MIKLFADEIDPNTLNSKSILGTEDDSTIAIIVIATISTIVFITIAIIIAKRISKKNGK